VQERNGSGTAISGIFPAGSRFVEYHHSKPFFIDGRSIIVMNPSLIAFLAGGLGLLFLGGSLLVRGASRMAQTLGMSSLLIGLTVVAFGTSAPELAASMTAALGGQGDIAFGNVVGSNILNILLILGASRGDHTARVAQKLVRVGVPIMVGLSVAVLVLRNE
jgi:cation:H+ antiporter